MRKNLKIVLFLLVSCLLCIAQSTELKPSNDTGVKENTPYATGAGNVNLTNGNLNLQIPLVSFPGRKGFNYNLSLVYDSKMWTPHPSYASPTDIVYSWNIDQPDSYHVGDFGWHLNTPALASGPWLTDSAGNHVGDGDYIVTLLDGSKHALGRTGYNSLYDWSTDAEDGSGVSINPNNVSDIVVAERDGTTYHFGSGRVEDTNGNYIQMPFGPDTVGRTLTTSTANGRLSSIGYRDSSGTQQTIALNYSTITILTATATPFAYPLEKHCSKSGSNCTNIYVSQPTNLAKTVLSSVTLPDNTSYTFSYNDYGELSEVVLPTGGYVKYEYTAYQHQESYWNYEMASCADGACGYLNITGDFREVSKKRVCSASVGVGGTCPAEDITVYVPALAPQYTSNYGMDVYEGVPSTDANIPPISYQRRISEGFTGYDESDINFSRYCSPHEAAQTIYDSSGAVLKSTTTNYNTYGNNPLLPISVTTSYNNGPSTTEQFTYDNQTVRVLMPLGVDYSLQTLQNVNMPIANVTQDTIFDYGETSTPLRKTVDTYLKIAPYTNVHILDRKLEEQVFDGANNLLSDTQYVYDAPQDGVVSSAAGSHGLGFTTPGNVSAVKRWRNTDGAWLTTKNRKFDDAGNVLLTEDPLGHQTLFSFADSWNESTCVPPSGSAAAYPTLVQNALGQQISTTYNSCTGTIATQSDANQQVTTTNYDLFNRPLTISYADGGFRQYSYPSPTQTTVQNKPALNVTDQNLWPTTQMFFDGIGRISQVANKNGESGSGWDLKTTCYDSIGRVVFSSYPSQTSSVPSSFPCSLSGDSFTLDGLARITQVTHSDGSAILTDYSGRATRTKDEGKDNSGSRVTRVTQVDALGRLASVCEKSSDTSQMGSSNTPLACGQDIPETGFLTSYQYDIHDSAGSAWQVTQSGLTNRYFVTNSLGQLVSASNPESGTTQYVYNDDGSLWERIRPKPNQTNTSLLTTTTYNYDAIHRLTQTAYDDGSTPAVNRLYDQATATTGQGLSNPVGRLTSVSTVSGESIDLYSYDPVGRVQSNWQCTPSVSCNTSKQFSYGYDLLGNMTSGSNGFGVSIGYSYNIASRLAGVTSSFVDANHPGALMSGLSYGPFGISAASFGNEVAEARGYTARGLVNSIADTVTLAQPAVPGSGSVTISGSERTIGGPPATSGSGSVTLSGSEQSTQVVNQPATSGVGTVNISGSEQTTQAQSSAGTPGSNGSVTITGSVMPGYDDSCPCHVYDSGSMWVTVGPYTSGAVQYHQGITATYMATALAANLSTSGSPVTATSSGATIYITSRTNGANTNYAVSVSEGSNRPDLFGDGSFGWSTGNLTGGTNPTYYTVYDRGTVTATVNGFSKSTGYDQGSTTSTIAAGLVSAFNGDFGSPVTASSSGASLTLTSKATGATANYSLAASSATNQGTYFAGPSFTGSPTSPTLLGAHDATYNTLFDTGTVSINVNGVAKNTAYDQNSTLAGMATALASAFNSDPAAPANASASGATITLTARSAGASTNYTLSSTGASSQGAYFSHASYAGSPSGANLAGGQDQGANVNDAGTVSVTVNGFAEATSYGQSSTPSSIASALSSAFNADPSSPVSASVSGGQVTLTAKAGGSATNYAISTDSTSTQSGFTGTSFPSSPSGANLAGGADSYQTPTTPYSVNLAYFPNGNVYTANDNVNGNWTYAYDDFNRLSSASKAGAAYSYTYDRFGNRWQQNGPVSSILTFSGGSNRMDGYSYDAAGNLLNDNAGHSFTYDAENRIIQVGTDVFYAYDGDGRRIRKTVSGVSTDYLYDLAGHEIAEMDSSGNWTRGEVFAGDRHIATYNNGTTYFAHSDWLGTERSRTTVNGSVCETATSLPFGDGGATTGNCNPSPNFFTGKKRDAESGLDYFGARYFSSPMGRWMSPDWSENPEALPYGDSSDPQTLNLYGYVGNNPMSNADADGHGVETAIADELAQYAAEHPEVVDAVLAGVARATTAVETATIGTGLRIIGGTGGFIGAAMLNPATVGQSDSEERAAMQQAEHEREQQQEKEPQTSSSGAGARQGGGRSGRQARLNELANDSKVSSADRGWLKNEQRQINSGNRTSLRTPPGKQLRHRRGKEARKGYSYRHSDLQDTDLHKTQHRVEKQNQNQ